MKVLRQGKYDLTFDGLLNVDGLDDSLTLSADGNNCGEKPQPIVMLGRIVNIDKIQAWEKCNSDYKDYQSSLNSGCGVKPTPIIVKGKLTNKAEIDAWNACISGIDKSQIITPPTDTNYGCGDKPDDNDYSGLAAWNRCMTSNKPQKKAASAKGFQIGVANLGNVLKNSLSKQVSENTSDSSSSTSRDTDSSSTQDDTNSTDSSKKILGMKKSTGVIVIVGGLGLLVGGYFLIKHFRK